MSSFQNPFNVPFGAANSPAPRSYAQGGPGSMTPGMMHQQAGQSFALGEAQRMDQAHRQALMDIMSGFHTSPQQLMQAGSAGRIGGHHMLGAVALDDLAARQAEAMNYGNVMNAARDIRSGAEAGASAIRTAGVGDLARMRQMGEQAINIADTAFEDMQRQFADVEKKYAREYGQARADQQKAIRDYGESIAQQQSAAASAIAQSEAARTDEAAAAMGGAIPGTQGQFQEASRQIRQQADQLKFKTVTDLAAEKERTTAGLQQTLAGMQQRSAEFGAGLGQAGAQLQYGARMGQQQARQLAAGLYQASAQQQAQAAQAAESLRLQGLSNSAQLIMARPFSPVSMLQTMITAMNAQNLIPRNQFGLVGGAQATPMNFGGNIVETSRRGVRQPMASSAPAASQLPPLRTTESGLMSPEAAKRLGLGPDWGTEAYQEGRRRGII
jgi:hypothetical protein